MLLAAGIAALVFCLAAEDTASLGGRGGPEHRGQPAGHSNPGPRSTPPRAPQARRPVTVDRPYHGTVRHSETHTVERRVEEHHGSGWEAHGFVHRDVDVDFGRTRYWHGFVYGRHLGELRGGYVQVYWNGNPYYYDDGIYFQPAADGYEEIYPPIGLGIPTLPGGFVQIEAGGLIYYYAAGAFYLAQGDRYVIAPAPIGVTVPELPPGAALVSVAGGPAFQFNGVYFRPVFVNGVTQYQTFLP